MGKPNTMDDLGAAAKKTVHYLYNIDGDVDSDIYKVIATLRQLINEEFKPEKSLSSQFIYDILNPVLTSKLKEVDRAAREIFVPVKGYEGLYEVSNTGKVRSVKGGRRRGVELKQQSYVSGTNRGYSIVSLVKEGKAMTATVHRLVASAFISNPENKPCVNHKDNNKSNNRVENLEWATYSENELHAYTLGKVNPISKLSQEKLEQARELIAGGQSKAATARQLGVAWSTLHRALTNQTWKRNSLKGGDV